MQHEIRVGNKQSLHIVRKSMIYTSMYKLFSIPNQTESQNKCELEGLDTFVCTKEAGITHHSTTRKEGQV